MSEKEQERAIDKTNNETNTNAPEENPRRRLLRALTLSGGVAATLPVTEKWVKPVVNSVVLPAHAQMSPQDGGTIDPGDPSSVCQSLATGESFVIPAGVTLVTATIQGAAGENGSEPTDSEGVPGQGGNGATIVANIAVSGGDTIGASDEPGGSGGVAAGQGNNGNGGAGGSSATLLLGGSLVLVAGGGGGGGGANVVAGDGDGGDGGDSGSSGNPSGDATGPDAGGTFPGGGGEQSQGPNARDGDDGNTFSGTFVTAGGGASGGGGSGSGDGPGGGGGGAGGNSGASGPASVQSLDDGSNSSGTSYQICYIEP